VYFKFDSVCLIYAILFDNLVGFLGLGAIHFGSTDNI
jgi:hypothetical protein